jgi:hypothetical protein
VAADDPHPGRRDGAGARRPGRLRPRGAARRRASRRLADHGDHQRAGRGVRCRPGGPARPAGAPSARRQRHHLPGAGPGCGGGPGRAAGPRRAGAARPAGRRRHRGAGEAGLHRARGRRRLRRRLHAGRLGGHPGDGHRLWGGGLPQPGRRGAQGAVRVRRCPQPEGVHARPAGRRRGGHPARLPGPVAARAPAGADGRGGPGAAGDARLDPAGHRPAHRPPAGLGAVPPQLGRIHRPAHRPGRRRGGHPDRRGPRRAGRPAAVGRRGGRGQGGGAGSGGRDHVLRPDRRARRPAAARPRRRPGRRARRRGRRPRRLGPRAPHRGGRGAARSAPAWFDRAGADRAVGALYALYREPGRHVAALAGASGVPS